MLFGYKGLVFCRNNGSLMENLDKELTVPKWVLINQPKIHQMLQNLSAQIVSPSPKVWDFDEKKLHWAPPIVRGTNYWDLKTYRNNLEKKVSYFDTDASIHQHQREVVSIAK